MKSKILLSILCLIIALTLLSGCSVNREYDGFGFLGTFYSFKGKGGVEQSKADDILERAENLLSVDSELKKVNDAQANEKVFLDKTTYSLILFAKDIYEKSEGALDITLYPIVKLWHFDNTFNESLTLVPPSDAEIEEALTHVGFHLFEFNDEECSVVKKDDKAALDLGAIGKGYAVSYFLKEGGFDEGLFDLGGTIGAVGASYVLGIEPPLASRASYFAKFTLHSGEVCSTSGNYQRRYYYEGNLYHHIFASNGRPVNNGLASVTVVCSDGKLADALSTACFVMGKEKAIALLRSYDAKAVFVYEDKTVSTVDMQVEITANDFVLK